MASKHRDIGLKFRHRSTPNTRRVTKDVGFGGVGGGYHICNYIYVYIYSEFVRNPRYSMPRTAENPISYEP